MPGPLLASRPSILDHEAYNSLPAFAGLVRRLIQNAQHTYCRDRLFVPTSPSFGSQQAGFPFYAAPAPTTSNKLQIRAYVKLPSSGSSYTLSLTPEFSAAHSFVIDYAALGNQLEGWYAATMPCAPGQRVTIFGLGSYAAGIQSVSVWWDPSVDGIQAPTGGQWQPIDWAHVAAGRAYNAALAKWLQHQAARLLYQRPRILLAHTTLRMDDYKPFAGTWYTAGRWKVPVGPGVAADGGPQQGDGNSLRLNCDLASAYSNSWRIYLNGTLVSGPMNFTTIVGNQPAGWAPELLINLPAGSAGSEVEVRLDYLNGGGTYPFATCFSLQERSPTDAECAAAIPSWSTALRTFPSMDASSIRAGAPIADSVLQALVKAFLNLMVNNDRSLICQGYGIIPYGANPGVQPARLRFPSSTTFDGIVVCSLTNGVSGTVQAGLRRNYYSDMGGSPVDIRLASAVADPSLGLVVLGTTSGPILHQGECWVPGSAQVLDPDHFNLVCLNTPRGTVELQAGEVP